jgi:hypothetical protein
MGEEKSFQQLNIPNRIPCDSFHRTVKMRGVEQHFFQLLLTFFPDLFHLDLFAGSIVP